MCALNPQNCQVAMDTMKKDKKVFLLGMIQSCFEGPTPGP